MGLTIKEIENAKPRDKKYKLTDGGGLCLIVKPSGAKLWLWRYRLAGIEKNMSFGEHPVVGLKDARELHFTAKRSFEKLAGAWRHLLPPRISSRDLPSSFQTALFSTLPFLGSTVSIYRSG
jgi:hypothetical protein